MNSDVLMREKRAYQSAVANLHFLFERSGCKKVAITSVTELDGKSDCALRLAETFAGSGQRTLLVDMNFASPVCAARYNAEGKAGISDCIMSGAAVADAAIESGTPGLSVLTAGTQTENPLALLLTDGGEAVQRALREAEQAYDVILLDCPELLASQEAAVTARRTDGMVVVLDRAYTTRKLFKRAMDNLALSDVKILGVLLNREAQPKRRKKK